MNNFPKILIIGGYLDLKTGGGITLTNLLKGWPSDRIAIISKKIEPDGIKLCSKYYVLGNNEMKRFWPFNKLRPETKSRVIDFSNNLLDKNTFEKVTKLSESKYNKGLKNFIDRVLHFMGLYYWIFSFKISNNLVSWIKDYDPDLLYSQLAMPALMTFTEQIIKTIKKPYVIHIMDDWIQTISKPGLSRIYWNPLFQEIFMNLIKNADGLLSISIPMSNEYKRRYGREFITFHNCIEIEFWSKFQKSNWEINEKFTILYAGRIGLGTSKSVLNVAKAVELIGEKGINIEFQIQTRKLPQNFTAEISKLNHTYYNQYIDYPDLPKKFSSVDLLVLPMDFDKYNLKFIHLSMPTKVPEYMCSGTPILVFADKSTALFKYASENQWAYIVAENSKEKLVQKLLEIFYNGDIRKEIALKAAKLAHANHDTLIVNKGFKDYLFKISNKNIS